MRNTFRSNSHDIISCEKYGSSDMGLKQYNINIWLNGKYQNYNKEIKMGLESDFILYNIIPVGVVSACLCLCGIERGIKYCVGISIKV